MKIQVNGHLDRRGKIVMDNKSLNPTLFKKSIDVATTLLSEDVNYITKKLYKYFGDHIVEVYDAYLNVPRRQEMLKNLLTFLTDWKNNKYLWMRTIGSYNKEEMTLVENFFKTLNVR